MCALRLLINLDGAEKRLQETAKQFEKCGLSFERVPAVDMRGKTAEELERHRADNEHVVSVGQGLAPGAVGCFLSHREAWKRIAASGERGGFVFEDDVYLSRYCAYFCSDDRWIPEAIDVCQISYMPRPNGKRRRFYASEPMMLPLPHGSQLRYGEEQDFFLLRLFHPTSWGTQAYWMSADAARFALADTEHLRFNRPVDGYLFEHLATSTFTRNRQVFALSPAIVWESRGNPSQIAPAGVQRVTDVGYFRWQDRVADKLWKYKLKLKGHFWYQKIVGEDPVA